MYSSAIRGCHEEAPVVPPPEPFGDILKLTGRTKSIILPEIRGAAAEQALDKQAWREAIANVTPLELKTRTKQVETVSNQEPGSAVDPGPGLFNGALCNDCDLAAEDVEFLCPEKPE
eukprot:349754-Chlamydomonas_euryale.AAC.9